LSTKNLTEIDQDAKPGHRGERPATNRLSHGTAKRLRYKGGSNFSAIYFNGNPGEGLTLLETSACVHNMSC
jgi:hypothetical protein